MEYRILGPMEVRDRGRSMSLGTAKEQALLAVLILHAGEFVPREQLIDELWGAAPPPTAAKAVQVYVSHLRKLLAHDGAEAITTHPRGYVLPLDGAGLDARSFARLAAEARERAAAGDAEQAASLFRKALALWRGPALAGLSFEAGARSEVERLEEERLAALMDRIDCDLGLGRHEQLVGELDGLVAQHPLRERLRAQLMLALYRSGRQADALRVYREGRETLVIELGLEPSEPLQRLERAILIHDPALEAAAGLTRPPPTQQRAPVLADRPRRLSRRRLAAVALFLVAAAAALVALLLARDDPAARLLEPNSVGFIDATSGRLTRSFPVGRVPVAVAVAGDSVWVANRQDGTVSHVDRRTGKVIATIPVQAHPTGVAVHNDRVWVWTVEGRLVPIDGRFDIPGNAVDLGPQGGNPMFRGIDAQGWRRGAGRITYASGFLWVTGTGSSVIRVPPESPGRRRSFVPSDGAGPVVAVNGKPWVGGFSHVFPIDVRSGTESTGAFVGQVHDLAFGAGSLWVVSGLETGQQQVRTALRRVDVHSRVVRSTVGLGSSPGAVAVGGSAVWFVSGTTIRRVDPEKDRPTQAIEVGATPTDLAGGVDGVWVTVK